MSKKSDNNGYNRQPDGTFGVGNCANPNGRPKFSLISILKDELQKCPKNKKTTKARLMIKAMLESAMNGNPQQIKQIFQYTEGIPKMTAEITEKENEYELSDEEFKRALDNVSIHK
jgi:hypothetical protein